MNGAVFIVLNVLCCLYCQMYRMFCENAAECNVSVQDGLPQL